MINLIWKIPFAENVGFADLYKFYGMKYKIEKKKKWILDDIGYWINQWI